MGRGCKCLMEALDKSSRSSKIKPISKTKVAKFKYGVKFFTQVIAISYFTKTKRNNSKKTSRKG